MCISMEKLLSISLRLNFTPNTLGYCALIEAIGSVDRFCKGPSVRS